MGMANSIAAIADRRGAYRRRRRAGSGAGAGNTPMEVFTAVRDRMGIETGVDLFKLMDLAEDTVVPMMDHRCASTETSLTLGYAGVYSTFLLSRQAGCARSYWRARTRHPASSCGRRKNDRRPGRHDRGHGDEHGALASRWRYEAR